jgi:outer membrane protein W
LIPKTIKLLVVILLFGLGVVDTSIAGPVEIQAIQISPVETTTGKYPSITANIKAITSPASNKAIEINVIASMALPNNIVKSWTWKKISMRSGETRKFSIPKEYDVKLAGVYKVDFSVYTTDMRPLHRLSKSFVVADAKQPVTKSTNKAGVGADSASAAFHHLGFGGYVNTVNTAGGATMFLWPNKYVGLQGSYSIGNFTTSEGRLLVRFPNSTGFNPYVGIGYMSVSTERTVEGIGTKAMFRDSGVSGAIGTEIPLSKNIVGYAEISGANIDLKKEVDVGGTPGTASVKYAPVTIGLSIVWYLF